MRRRISLLGILLALASSAAARAQDARPEVPELMRVGFEGELLDELDQPISGVFPLTFSLFRSAGAESAVWAETQYVAVLEGVYEVQLGRVNGIPADWAEEHRVVEVSLGDVGVISSQELVLWPWTPDAEAAQPTIRYERYVDLAGHAIDADRAAHARDCRTLGGESVGNLDRYDELRAQLDEVRNRVERPAGNRIGGDPVVLPRIGGDGGNAYERNCPPGFVMTGARGGGGNLIDGFRIICTQLQ